MSGRMPPPSRTSRLPDSLTNVFHTEAGREVRDGGGIRPDIEPKSEELSTLLYYLIQDMAIFDFATEFKINNKSIASAESFSIDDELYAQFCEYLKKRGFTYDLQSAKMLKEFKKLIEFEGFTAITKDEIEALEKKLHANLDHSLEHFKKDVKDLIADEIVKRYYGRDGEIIYSLREDADLKEAFRILNDKEEYRKILSPQKKN